MPCSTWMCENGHGVLAPNAKWRSQIVPQVTADPLSDYAGEAPIPSTPKQSISWARLLKRVFNIDMERCPNCQGRLTISSPAHPSALAPCFALPPASMQSCARAFSASLHVIAAIEDPSTIAKILKHLGLPARAPPRAPAKNHAFYEFTEFA